MIKISNLFSDFLFIEKLKDIDNTTIIDYLEKLADTKKGVSVSNRGGYQTENLFWGDFPAIDEVASSVEYFASQIAEQLGFKPVTIQGCWGNVNYKYNYNTSHIHSHSLMSAVYYPRALPNQGRIIFQRDNLTDIFLHETQDKFTQYNKHNTAYQPYTGDLLIFPSWVNHAVEANMLDTSRVSLAFNLGIAGIPN